MFYVHSLLSTWVFHCSIWISQENICGHSCFGTNEAEKYESLPWMRFIKNSRVIALFFLSRFKFLATQSLWATSKANQHEYIWEVIWFDPLLVWNRTIWSFMSCKSFVGSLSTMSPLPHRRTSVVFFFSFVIFKSQIGLKSVCFICYECLVGQR